MTANQGSTTMRNVPDVSMVANNLNLVWGNDFIGASSDFAEGGTSLATPLWAGLVAMANQQAAANGQPPIGFVNPALYAIAKSANYQSCFHDITTGSNTNSFSPTKYNAVAGYDLCTGLGTPNGGNLIPALLAPPSDNLLVTPPLGFTAFGPGGGPFTVNSQTYTLKNTGSTSLNWNLVNTSSWLTVSSTSGSLNPGASATVTINLNSTANNFLINHASANVVLNNLTAGTTQNRQFDLYVGNGGFETGGLDDWTLVGSTRPWILLWRLMMWTWRDLPPCPARPTGCLCIRGFTAHTSANGLGWQPGGRFTLAGRGHHRQSRIPGIFLADLRSRRPGRDHEQPVYCEMEQLDALRPNQPERFQLDQPAIHRSGHGTSATLEFDFNNNPAPLASMT